MIFTAQIKLFESHLVQQGKSPGTVKAYTRDALAFLIATGVQSLPELTLEMAQAWDAELARTKSPATRARYRNGTRTFIDYGRAHFGIPNLGEFSPLFVPQHDVKLPTQEELVLILNTHRLDPQHPLEFRDCAVTCLIAMTGVRRSEARLLNIGDVFLDKSSFQIIATSTKGAGQRRIINFGDLTKSHDIAGAYFGRYIAHRLSDMGGSKSQRALNAPLFSSPDDPTKRLSVRTFNNIIDAACLRVKDGVRDLSFVTPHILRHFFATYCYVNGMRIENIQKYMGHADIKTTERYIHMAEKVTGVQAREHGPMVGLKARNDLYLGNADHQQNYFRALIPSTAS